MCKKMKCENCTYRASGKGFGQKWVCIYILYAKVPRGCGSNWECTKFIEGEPNYSKLYGTEHYWDDVADTEEQIARYEWERKHIKELIRDWSDDNDRTEIEDR